VGPAFEVVFQIALLLQAAQQGLNRMALP
jgi:hypothetical protein